MQAYAGDGDVFIRSMASRGHAGGLASTSTAAAAVMDASGFDLILIETVGTGQSEVEVAAAADTTVVLEAPEMGDEVQAIKAGLLEVADLVVVNKGDRPGRPAHRLAAPCDARRRGEPEGRGGGGDERPRPKRPDVLVTTATTGEGVDELLVALDRHRDAGRERGLGGAADKARLARAEAQVWAILSDRLRDALREVSHDDATRATLAEVAEHRLDPVCRRRPVARIPGIRSEVTGTTGDRMITRPFVVLVAAGLAFFTAGSAVLPVASQFAEGPLDASTIGVGIAIGAFAIGSLLLRPVVGWGSDRYGRRPMLVFGALLSIAALGLHLVVDSLPLFIVARAMLGAAEAFFFVAFLAAASDLAPPGRRGEAFNLASLALYIGLALGPPIGETVLDSVGYDAVWVAAAGLTIVAAVLSLAVPETAPAVLAAATGEPKRVRVRLFHPAGLFPGLLVLLGTWGMAGYFAFVPLHAKQIGMSGSAVPLTVYAALVVVLRLAFAKLPDQIGAARLSGTALVVAAVGLTIIGLVQTPLGLVAGSAVFAFGMAFMMPALLTLAVSRADETERGAVVGTTSLFLDLSFGLSPAVLGAVAGVAGYDGAFLVSAAVAGCGAALLAVRRHALAAPVPAGAATLDA